MKKVVSKVRGRRPGSKPWACCISRTMGLFAWT